MSCIFYTNYSTRKTTLCSILPLYFRFGIQFEEIIGYIGSYCLYVRERERERERMKMMKLLKFVQLLWCLLFVLEVFPVQGNVHYYDFVLKETNVTKLCVSRQILTVNDSFPGPTIKIHKGDTVFVNVHNQGLYGVTIHWHGVKQPRNPWSDGPEYITQCAIQPGSNFTYEVIFSDEEGTLWWHAHSDWTRATVHGAIVILPKNGTTFPYSEPDGQEVLILAPWYKEDLKEAVDADLEIGTDVPHSSGYTINGQLGDFSNCSSNETIYYWTVDYGKTYLLRIINAVLNAELFFAIADHNLTVVGMDGSYLKPFVTSYIMISPGNTVDVLLTANQSSFNRYYIAARQFSSENAADDGFDHSIGSAILQYSESDGSDTSLSDPIFPNDTLPVYLDANAAIHYTNQLKSLANEAYPISVPLNVTTRMYIVVSMNLLSCPPGVNCSRSDDNVVGSSMNNVSWLFKSEDILQAYYRNISGVYTTDFPDWPSTMYDFTGEINESNMTSLGTKVKVLEYNESVEVVFQGTNLLDGSMNHPVHMHGHSFYVVGRGFGNFDNETDPNSYNLVDPPAVNTFGVPKKGWLAIRFTAGNPGVWFWHCHLDRHMSWGMDTVFIVKDGGTEETSLRPPPSYMPSCSNSSNIRINQESKNFQLYAEK